MIWSRGADGNKLFEIYLFHSYIKIRVISTYSIQNILNSQRGGAWSSFVKMVL